MSQDQVARLSTLLNQQDPMEQQPEQFVAQQDPQQAYDPSQGGMTVPVQQAPVAENTFVPPPSEQQQHYPVPDPQQYHQQTHEGYEQHVHQAIPKKHDKSIPICQVRLRERSMACPNPAFA